MIYFEVVLKHFRLPRVALQSLERAARGVAGSNLRPSSTRNATCGGQLSAGEKCGSCSQLSTRVRADHSSEEAGPGSGGSSLTTSTLPQKGPTSLKSPEKRAPPSRLQPLSRRQAHGGNFGRAG